MPCPVRGHDLGHFSFHLSDLKFFAWGFILKNVARSCFWYVWRAPRLGGNISCSLFRVLIPSKQKHLSSFMYSGWWWRGGGIQHFCCCCWNSGKRAGHGAVLANLAASFFQPTWLCTQYSVWVWEDLSAFFLCREAMRNEAMDLSYTTAWKK